MAMANVRWADCREADLGEAYLAEADLRDTNFAGARLEGAILAGYRRPEMEAFHVAARHFVFGPLAALRHKPPRPPGGARYSGKTIWPEGFDAEAAGAVLKD